MLLEILNIVAPVFLVIAASAVLLSNMLAGLTVSAWLLL